MDKDKKQEFISTIENKLDAVREAIGDPLATIHYPVLPKGIDNSPFAISPRMIMSYVQTFEDLEQIVKLKKIDTPNDDSIVFLDEAHMLFNTKAD